MECCGGNGISLTGSFESLGSGLIEEIKLLRGVNRESDQLKSLLRDLHCYLKAADSVADWNGLVRNWLIDGVDALFLAEDLLEYFSASRAAHSRKNFRRRLVSTLPRLISRRRAGLDFKSVNSRVVSLLETARGQLSINLVKGDHVHHQSGGGGVSGNGEIPREPQRPRTFPQMTDDDVNLVGMEESINMLVRKLADGEEAEQCRIVAICGMGGLEKTTVARQVFNHAQVRRKFEYFAWVYVGKQNQPVDTIRSIVKSLTGLDTDGMSQQELISELYEVQRLNKCLVVLDEIWETNVWSNSLKNAFPPASAKKISESSKILLTTRKMDVARHIDPWCYVHPLRFLTADETWELFKKRTFPNHDNIDPIKTALGKEMLKHCQGVPLAIIVLGGLLAQKAELYEWQEAKRRIHSLLGTTVAPGQPYALSQALAFSYYELPYHLKQCLLYLAAFPGNNDIPKEQLIRMWEAEGLLSLSAQHHNNSKQSDDNLENLEHTAEGYLNALVDRSIIQVARRTLTGRVKAFRLHDLMRDLCLSEAKGRKFLSIVKGMDREPSSVGMRASKHRMAIHLDRKEQDQSSTGASGELTRSLLPTDRTRELKHLRSLMVFKKETEELQTCHIQISTSLEKFPALRVLALENHDYQIQEVGSCILLKYLSLRGSNLTISNIPSSIMNLLYLETLDLNAPITEVVKVPDVLWRLVQLRHLYLPRAFITSKGITGGIKYHHILHEAEKLRLDTLRNLETLVNFNGISCRPKDLLQLNKLRRLKIRLFHVEDLRSLLHESSVLVSQHLEHLSLQVRFFRSWEEEKSPVLFLSNCQALHALSLWGIDAQPVPSLAPGMISDSLYKLTLYEIMLYDDPMPMLEKLPHLVKLVISYNAYVGDKMVCSSGNFAKLKHLEMSALPELEEWEVEEGALPCLQRLEVLSCLRLSRLPDSLKSISSLHTVTFI